MLPVILISMENFDVSNVGGYVAIAEGNLARLSASLRSQFESDTIDYKLLSDCIFQNQSQALRQIAIGVYVCGTARFGVANR